MAFDAVIDKTQLEKEMVATADSIRAKTGSTNLIKWSADTGFANAIQNIQTGSEENMRIYTGTISETLVGSGLYKVLAKDDVLAEHRNDESLFVKVEFDIEPTAYTIVKSWGVNNVARFPIKANTIHQYTQRYDGSSVYGYGTIEVPINTDSPVSVGCLQITEDGELRCYSNSSSNYAIRPSNYTVIVEW